MNNFVRLLIALDKAFYWLSRAAAVIAGTFIALTTVMICAYIINRQFIGQVWLFVEEWTALLLLPISYLGMSYTLRWNRHLRVDILTMRCGPKLRNILTAAACLFSLIVLAFMIERGLDWFWYNWTEDVRSSGAMRTPLWIFSLSMVIGLVMYFIDTVFYFFDTFLVLMGRPERLRFFE
jgi:C4-dicarboxylate transporter, DctQ subunit